MIAKLLLIPLLAAIYCAILAALIATDVVGSAVFFLLLDMVGSPAEYY
jgi:hypothetical protein